MINEVALGSNKPTIPKTADNGANSGTQSAKSDNADPTSPKS